MKRKMNAILKAFKDYIDNQDYFDIVYSKKSAMSGLWLMIPVRQGAEQLDTPKAMLNNLFNDIINDVAAPHSTTHLDEAITLTESEKAECRRKITAILETIEGGGGTEELKARDQMAWVGLMNCCKA